jgi:phosphoglycolate phosphatase
MSMAGNHMKYQAVIFDLDGTLLDTIQDLAESMNGALASMGYPVHDVQKYVNLVGNGIENLAMRVLPEDIRSEELTQRCVSIFRSQYNNNWTDKTKPYNGIPKLLNILKAKQIKMAVLSNKMHVFTEQMVLHFFGSDYFKDVRGEIPGVPRKPDPTAALDISKNFSLNPAQIIFVGDGGTDMQTAVSAGMFPVGVLWGYQSAKELIEYGAKKLIDKPDELLRLLD